MLARLLVLFRSEFRYIAYNIALIIVLGFTTSIAATMAPQLFTGPTQAYIVTRLREVYGVNVNTLDEVPKPLLVSIVATDLTPMIALLLISSAVASSVARVVEKYRVYGMFERIIPSLGLAGSIKLLLGYGVVSALVSICFVVAVLLLLVMATSMYFNVEISLSTDYAVLLVVVTPLCTLFSVGVGLTVSLGLMSWRRLEKPSEAASMFAMAPPLAALILASLGFTGMVVLLVAILLVGTISTFAAAMVLARKVKIANIVY